MSHLYNLYTHAEKGQWGFTAVIDGAVHTAFVDARDGAVTTATVQPMMLAPRLAALLRSGYRRDPQPQYLARSVEDGRDVGRFQLRHPDLGDGLSGELILFAAVPPQLEMAEVVDTWRDALDGTDSPDHAARTKWLGHCERLTAYAPAMSHDAHGVLLVAQWARSNNLILVAAKGSLPAMAPKDGRYEWREYLLRWFTAQAIDSAMNQLGWALSDGLVAAAPPTTSTSPDDGDHWIGLANQAAF